LSKISEAASVIHEEPRRVVFMFQDGFTEKHKRPRRHEAVGCFPFVPNSLVGFPRALGHGALEEAMLWRFLSTRVANFAWGGGSP
jgi:hypothetical protein